MLIGHEARPSLSVVIPCYNEEDVLPETASRIDELLDRLISEGVIHPSSHVCFVDDGSRDRTWSLIEDLNRTSDRLRGIKLSRNCGHQSALLAGLMTVQGDLVVSIDADLQDDVAAIGEMVRAALDGADVVYGVRAVRTSDTRFKRGTAEAYYRVLDTLGVEIVPNHADFRLLSRRALEALRTYDEANLFLRALIPKLGFKSQIVYYERAERFAGTSKYPFRKMVGLAIDGITSFSNRPLRFITILGIVTSVAAMLLTAWALYVAIVLRANIPGWASIVIPIYLVCGVQLVSLGVIGEYVGKIYLETKRRPRFHIAETLDPAPR